MMKDHMTSRIISVIFCLLTSGLMLPAQAASLLQSVTAITQVFGDGQQVVAVALKYSQPIDGSKLKASMFKVSEVVPPQLLQHDFGQPAPTQPETDSREISRVYTNTAPAISATGKKGAYVILELAYTYHYLPPFKEPGKGGHGTQKQGAGNQQRRMLPQRVEIIKAYNGITRIDDLKAQVCQVKDIKTVSGAKSSAFNTPVTSTKTINLVVDDFQQLIYKDETSGLSMAYNLFVPKDYDATKHYPLVLFMPDATVTSPNNETTRTLTQGTGAIIWATPGEQAKHPCFVLAPQYPLQIINDDWETNDYMDMTVNLIHELENKYSIDTHRMYTTGQSGGCMLSFAIDNKYPDLFAASLLVAGKWDSTRVSRFVTHHQKMWMFCGEGDFGAMPSMTGITHALEKLGAKVSKTTWDGRSTPEQWKGLCAKIDAEGNDFRWVTFPKGSVFRPGHEDGMEHLQTWRVVYGIEGARDWLFRQSK